MSQHNLFHCNVRLAGRAIRLVFTAATGADTLADTQRDERGTDVLKREEISGKEIRYHVPRSGEKVSYNAKSFI